MTITLEELDAMRRSLPVSPDVPDRLLMTNATWDAIKQNFRQIEPGVMEVPASNPVFGMPIEFFLNDVEMFVRVHELREKGIKAQIVLLVDPAATK